MKRVISIILTICTFTTIMGFTATAETSSNEKSIKEIQKEAILKEYDEQLSEIRKIEHNNSIVSTQSIDAVSAFNAKLQIQSETVSALREIGYEAYDVNPQTFEEIETELKTDLTEAGLSEEGAYIITINEESFIYPDAAVSDPFSHTYNGTTYSLRWMTVRHTDDPAFEKYSYENILNDNNRDVIINFLDAAVGMYVGAIWEPLGTMSSLLGLSIADFWESQSAYCIYNASSIWARRYTQVWSNYDQAWAFGCYVEEVTTSSYMNGWYYNSVTHTQQPLVVNEQSRTIDSPRADDWDWRKNYAVIGYLNSYIYPDITGDVEYYYDGDAIITHRHNF